MVTAEANISVVTISRFTLAEEQTTVSLTINAAGIDSYDPDETIGIRLLASSGYSIVSNTTGFDPAVGFVAGSGLRSVKAGGFIIPQTGEME